MSRSPEHFRVERREEDGDGHRVLLRVAESSAWFEGHFPGEPILPAVGQVQMVADLADDLGLLARNAAGIPKLRLVGQVAPGARLEVRLHRTDRRLGFQVREADGEARAISDGELAVATAAPGDTDDPVDDAPGHESPTRTGAATRLDPAQLLPHRPPALLAAEIVGFDPGGDDERADPPALLCRGRVPAEHPSVHRGEAGTWMAVELAAQAAGLLEAARRTGGGTPAGAPLPIGYLVRVRGARFHHPTLPAAADLLARVEPAGGSGPLTLYRATVGIPGGLPLATLTFGTFVPSA